jgi:hypothetical protein
MYVDTNEIAYIPFINAVGKFVIISVDLTTITTIFYRFIPATFNTINNMLLTGVGNELIIIGSYSISSVTYGYLLNISTTGSLNAVFQTSNPLMRVSLDSTNN